MPMSIESGTALPSSATAKAPTPTMLTDEGTATETNEHSEDWDIEEVPPSEQVDDHLEVGRVITEGHCEYYVEKVVDYFVNKGKKDWFLVKWWGWSTAHNTWELTEHLEHAHEYVKEYFQNNPKQATRRANVIKYWDAQKKKREKKTTKAIRPRNAPITKMPRIRVPKSVAQDVVELDHLEQQTPTLMTEEMPGNSTTATSNARQQLNTGTAVSQIPTDDGIMTRARARSLHPELYAQKKACASKCRCIMCDPAPKLTAKKFVPVNVLDKKETLKQTKAAAKKNNVARNKKRKLIEQTPQKADGTSAEASRRGRGRPPKCPKPKKETPAQNRLNRVPKAVISPTFGLLHDVGVLTRAQKKILCDIENPASTGKKRKNDYALRSAGTRSAHDCQPSSSAKAKPSSSSKGKGTKSKSNRGKVEIDFSKHQDWIFPFVNQNLYGVLERILANPDPAPSSDAFNDFFFPSLEADLSIPRLYPEELDEGAELEESLLSTSAPEPIPPTRPRTTFIYAVPPPPPMCQRDGVPRENAVQG